MSVSGPRQLRRSGTWLGQYSLKRLIYCGNIAVRSMSWEKQCGDGVEEMLKMASGMNFFFYVTCMYWLYI